MSRLSYWRHARRLPAAPCTRRRQHPAAAQPKLWAFLSGRSTAATAAWPAARSMEVPTLRQNSPWQQCRPITWCWLPQTTAANCCRAGSFRARQQSRPAVLTAPARQSCTRQSRRVLFGQMALQTTRWIAILVHETAAGSLHLDHIRPLSSWSLSNPSLQIWRAACAGGGVAMQDIVITRLGDMNPEEHESWEAALGSLQVAP